MPTRQEWTALVLQQAGLCDQLTEHQANQLWWQDSRLPQAMRLTRAGYDCFVLANQPCYQFQLPAKTSLWGIHLLTLSRRLKSPFYLAVGRQSCLTLFGGTEATMYALYGDLNRFVHALAR